MKQPKEIIKERVEIFSGSSCRSLAEVPNKCLPAIESAMFEYGDQLKELLRKYITHVVSCEGVDFIYEGGMIDYSEVKFTHDEMELLKLLATKPLDF